MRCEFCGAVFTPAAKTPHDRQRFCSSKHRLAMWRINKERLASGDRRYVNKR